MIKNFLNSYAFKTKIITTAFAAMISLATFTAATASEFVCRPYPEYSVLGIPDKDLGKAEFSKGYTYELEFSMEKDGKVFDNKIISIIKALGQPPFPIDEIQVWKKDGSDERVVVWVYKNCVMNATNGVPELLKIVLGQEI